MIRICLCVLLLTGCAAASGAPGRGGSDAESRYRRCPGSTVLAKLADVSWKPQESRIARHRDLRSRLNLEFPEGAKRILLYSTASHHTTVEFSIVAVRRTSGIWHVDAAGRQARGLLDIEPKDLPRRVHDLSAEDSRRVDGLVADRCLLAGPAFLRDPDIVAGGAAQTLEIIGGRRSAVFGWFGRPTPEAQKLIDLITRD